MPHFQVEDFLGGGMPDSARIWSKAGMNGWTGDVRASYFKHDLIRVLPASGPATIICLMTQGKSICEDKPLAYPRIGALIAAALGW